MKKLFSVFVCLSFAFAALPQARQTASSPGPAASSGPFVFSAQGTGHAMAFPTESLSSYGPCVSYASAWCVDSLRESYLTFGRRGIANGHLTVINKPSVGDGTPENGYFLFSSGWTHPSDEGFVGKRIYVNTYAHYWVGTSNSAGTGLILPSLSDSTWGGATAQYEPANDNFTIDGSILVDLSKATIAPVTVTGASAPLAITGFPGSYLNTFPTSGGLPLLTGAAYCPTRITHNDAQPQVNLPFTCTVTVLDNLPLTAGGLVWVAGPNYPEQAPITAASAVTAGQQTITINVRQTQEAAGSLIIQGPWVGQYISADANLAEPAAMRTSWYAFGSFDGVHLVYGFFPAGSSSQLPNCGSQAFCPGTTGRNGVHFYPGAEIVANLSTKHDPQLEPNAIPFSVGDLLEDPQPDAVLMGGIKLGCGTNAPPNGADSRCMEIEVGGQGAVYTYKPLYIGNNNSPSIYSDNGGKYAGMTAGTIAGYFSTGFSFGIMPGGALFNIQNYLGASQKQLFSFNNGGQIYWDFAAQRLSTYHLGSTDYLGPSSAPSGACATAEAGARILSQDGRDSLCTATSSTAGVWLPASSNGNIQVTVGTTTVPANSCLPSATTYYTASMAGMTSTMTANFGWSADYSSVTGWTPAGSTLYFTSYPTAGVLNYQICNGSSAPITPSAATVWNVSAK